MFALFSCILWFIGGVNNPTMFPDAWSCVLFGLKLDGFMVVVLPLIFLGDYIYHEKIKKDDVYSLKEKR